MKNNDPEPWAYHPDSKPGPGPFGTPDRSAVRWDKAMMWFPRPEYDLTIEQQDDDLFREAEALVGIGYEPFDAEEHLGNDHKLWTDDGIARWEEAHGHDIRLKCYAEFGCTLLEVPYAAAFVRARAERDAAVEAIEKIIFQWDVRISRGFQFFNLTEDASIARVAFGPYIDAFERKQHDAYEAELENDE